MEELKTLKDIDSAVDINGVSDELSVFVNDLKQEAIKWIKNINVNRADIYCDGQIDFIMTFFNLTKEDLN